MTDADVIVVGGGPAGSTAATMLARKGWNVRLYERERFPREHIGESLLPASIPILEELGALPAVQAAGFLPKWGATMVWGTSAEPWSWYFRETNVRNPHSYQVWRPQFDQILLENSRAAGVDVREGQRVVDVLFDGPRATGVRTSVDGGEEDVAAKFVVDASGQTGLIGRKLGLRQSDDHFRNLAMYAYFAGAEALPTPDETNILVESYSDGWAWVIPLHTGETSVGFVMDSKVGQEAISKLGPSEAYWVQLSRTAKTREMLRRATRTGEPRVIRDWSYVSAEIAGNGYVLAGDAACFIDPLFSTGVHLALSAGVMSAAYVTSALKDPGIREAAGKAYKDLYYQQYYLFRELARLFYASNRAVDSYFWEARRIIGGDDSLGPREAFIRAAAGQSAKGYERMVFEHGEPPEGFLEAVERLEGERGRRSRAAPPPSTAEGLAELLRTVPVLSPGVHIQRQPVLGAGEFAWGDVIVAPGRSEHFPVSALVAELINRCDGQRALADIVEALSGKAGSAKHDQLATASAQAVRILYIDGIIAELRRP